MNLALIDPFQLAQDYPDVLIDDLSKLSPSEDGYCLCACSVLDAHFSVLMRHSQSPAMLPRFGSTGKVITLRQVEQMGKLSFGT
jgi:hypothetical protein